MTTEQGIVCGLFVGGQSSRMGGHPKGLLASPDTKEPLVARLARLSAECGFETVLVGDASPYRTLLPGVFEVADEPAGLGPLGGLAGLLRHALPRRVIALACDLPRVSAPLLTRLGHEQPDAEVLAPMLIPGVWEPLCARYDAVRVLPVLSRELARGTRSFQKLLAALEPRVLAGSELLSAELQDWDAPEDID